MKFKLLHTILDRIPAAAVVLAVGMLSACGNDFPEPDNTPVALSDIDVSISLTAGKQNTSRNIAEDFGTHIENRIDLSDLRVLIFNEVNTLKEILYNGSPADNVRLLKISEVDYVLTARLDPTKYGIDDDISVVVLSNWKSLSEEGDVSLIVGKTKISDLQDKSFLLNNEAVSEGVKPVSWIPYENADENSLIPMFGVLYSTLRGYSADRFNEGNPMNLGTVELLRSLVKIEIIDGRANKEDVEITSIELIKRNTRGYLPPEIDTERKINTGQIVSPNIPGSSNLSTEAGITSKALVFHKEDNKYVAYVPEIKLADDLEYRKYIGVNIHYHDYDETRYISLSTYDDEGNPYRPDEWPNEWKALLRNHIYRFTINSITADPNISLTVDVQPFSNVDLSVDLGLERTEDGYIVVRDSQGQIVKYIRTDGSILTMAQDTRWPYLGSFSGVFDSSKRVLIGFYDDGRSIIFNYNSDEINDNDPTEHLDSWEIYSSPTLEENGRLIPEHLQETFCFVDYENDSADKGADNKIIKHRFTHTQLDDKGRVVEEYRYATLEDFQNHKKNLTGVNRTKLADFSGDRYGDKVIIYYTKNGNIQLEVTGNNEEYI